MEQLFNTCQTIWIFTHKLGLNLLINTKSFYFRVKIKESLCAQCPVHTLHKLEIDFKFQHVGWLVLIRVLLFITPWTVACQAPLSMGGENFQARILERVAISSSRGSAQPRNWTHVSCISCVGKWILYHGATWEALGVERITAIIIAFGTAAIGYLADKRVYIKITAANLW